MPIFVLPKLKTNSELTLPDRCGEWQKYPRASLKALAKDLDYAAPGDRNLVNSVPTMWAAPLMMEMGLIDKSHPLHRDTVTQWQGMLAAIALAKVRSLPLKVVRVDLDEYRRHQFAEALVKLKPTETHNLYQLRNKNAWLDNYIWYWNDRPVGMTSPSTLVVPIVEGNWKHEKLTWWNSDTKRFRRPHDYLSSDEQRLLKGWLINLENELMSSDGKASAINSLVGLISAFHEPLSGNISAGDIPSLLDDDPAYFGTQISTGTLIALNKPAKLKDIGVGDSHLRLVPSEGKNPAKSLLILDLDITKAWNVQPQDIRVHKDKTLASLSLEDLRSGKIMNWDDVVWRETKDLFLPNLTFIDREAALPGSIVANTNQTLVFNGKNITPLLPIDDILLEYFTPEDLVKRLKFTQNETSNTVRVTLTLPLSGINPQSKRPQEFQFYEDFPLEEEHALFSRLPVLEVWPNFRLNNWQEYYAFYYDCELGERTFNVEFPQAKEPHNFEEDSGKYLITRLSEFPSHIRCIDSYREALGLILIKQPPALSLTENWKVGVDFGTSFTNIYVNHKDAADRLKINPQDERNSLHLKVAESDTSTRVNVLFEYFIPERFIPADTPLPLASILTTRGQTGTRPRPIYDGRIYVPKYGSADHREIENTYIETDLKWKSIEVNRLFRYHLSLIVSAIAAKQGVKQIEWSISYPSAFSRRDLTQYAQSWKEIAAELQTKTGIQQICPEQPDFRTESLAIAQYFGDRETYDLIRSVCIDLGGGTADISLWQDNHLIHQCSIQLAGRHLFSQLIAMRPELLAKWFDNQDNWNNLAPDIFKTKIDVLLREKSEHWLKDERHKYEEDPDFLGFVRLVSLGMAGLYYYIGTIVDVMRQENKYTESKIPSIYIGGNGSRLLNWIVPTGIFSSNSAINELFNRLLSKASGLEEVGEPTRVSKIPKDEVACGLVLNRTKLSIPTGKNQDHPIAGENFIINNDKKLAFDTRLDLKGIADEITKFEIPELEHLKRFVDEFNDAVVELEIEDVQPLRTYKKGQDLDPVYSKNLWDRVDRELRNVLSNMSGDATAIREEPPFILGLKALLTVLAREWAGR